MNPSVVALFGEASKGDLTTIYFCRSVEQLFEFFGNPPEDTKGLYYAIQTLLYGKQLIYFRVKEEGISIPDYEIGLKLLRDYSSTIPHIDALCLPQVGTSSIIEESLEICKNQKSILLIQETDLYDYLTDRN